MQKISDSTNTANGSGEFTEGSAAGGIPATQIKAAWLNTVQRELLNVIESAGLSTDKGDDGQLYKAVKLLARTAAEFENIGNKPTTLGGYGITDAYTITQVGTLLSGKANKGTTLASYGIADAYTAAQSDALLTEKAGKATTLAGYGITDGLRRGEFGLGATKILPGSIDVIGLPGGFYTFGSGVTSFAQYSTLINLPHSDERYGSQIGLVFGGAEPKLAFRICSDPGVWGPTRYAWHDGNFDPTTKADKSATYTKAQVDGIVAGNASNAITLGGYGITDAYTVTQVNNLLAGKANNASTLAGYGITDALRRGDSGLGVPVLAAASPIDTIGLNSGFHVMGAGSNTLANYCSVLQLPYASEGYAAQIAILQGQADVEVRVRACKAAGQWGPTRRVLTDASQATTQMAVDGADDRSWLSPAKLRDVLVNKFFGAFAVSLGVNGYLAFPIWLGGLIFQWGRVPNASASGTTASLAIAFPNACFSANCSAIGNLATQSHEVTEIFAITQNSVVVSNSGGGSVAWWAIGN